jgi:hypothetical protein
MTGPWSGEVGIFSARAKVARPTITRLIESPHRVALVAINTSLMPHFLGNLIAPLSFSLLEIVLTRDYADGLAISVKKWFFVPLSL